MLTVVTRVLHEFLSESSQTFCTYSLILWATFLKGWSMYLSFPGTSTCPNSEMLENSHHLWEMGKTKLAAANSWTWVEVRILVEGWKTFKTIFPIIFWQEKPSLKLCLVVKTWDSRFTTASQLKWHLRKRKRTYFLSTSEGPTLVTIVLGSWNWPQL